MEGIRKAWSIDGKLIDLLEAVAKVEIPRYRSGLNIAWEMEVVGALDAPFDEH